VIYRGERFLGGARPSRRKTVSGAGVQPMRLPAQTMHCSGTLDAVGEPAAQSRRAFVALRCKVAFKRGARGNVLDQRLPLEHRQTDTFGRVYAGCSMVVNSQGAVRIAPRTDNGETCADMLGVNR
jgi:hypothetical protein